MGIRPTDSAGVERSSPAGGNLETAVGLLGSRQRIALVLLTLERIAVGLCDLAVAAAMYLLLLLLQDRLPAHHLWWLPQTTLSAAVIASILVVLRALMDLFSSRSVLRQIQKLYTDLLLRLTRATTRCAGADSLSQIAVSCPTMLFILRAKRPSSISDALS